MKLLSLLSAALICSHSLLQAAGEQTTQAPADQGLMQTLVMIGIALLFFYFILWRPEQKRRKAMDAQRNAMKKGDRVTAMGILGTISKIKEETVIVRMCDGSEIEFLKAAISDVHPASTESAKESSKE